MKSGHRRATFEAEGFTISGSRRHAQAPSDDNQEQPTERFRQ